MNAREIFTQWLLHRNIRVVFGNPGSTEIPMLIEWPSEVDYVLGLQESIVVAMADGYAQSSGRPALVSLHSAQGLGNAIGALRTATCNHSPMVILVGQEDTRHHVVEPILYGEMTSLGQAVVKWAYEVCESSEVVPALEKAYQLAALPPQGPVLISVPMNLWDGPATPIVTRQVQGVAQPAGLQRLADALSQAERPALVIGASAAQAKAWDALIALAEKLECPVYGAPLSSRMGFPNQHPLYQGALPPVMPLIFQTLSIYDVVAVLGAPAFFTYPYVPGPRTLTHTQIHHVTDVPQELASSLADFGYLGDVLQTVEYLSSSIGVPLSRKAAFSGATRLAQRRSAAVRARSSMGVPFVLDTLARTLPEGTVIVDEAVSASPLAREYLEISGPGQYFAAATGGLGWGLAAAAGIALAEAKSRILVLIGDGASMYGIQALWGIAQRKLPVGIVVLNNGRYSILEEFGKLFYPGRESTIPGLQLPGLSLVDIAAAMGVPSAGVRNPGALEAELWRNWEQGGPFLLDVAVAKEHVSLN